MAFSIFSFLNACTGIGRTYVIENGLVYHRITHEGNYGKLTELPDADAETFEVLEQKEYAKDKKNVYREGKIIEGADPDSFEVLENDFARDKDQGYFQSKAIPNSIGKDFKVLRWRFSTDGSEVFWELKPLGVTDIENFRFLNTDKSDPWSTDGRHYFSYGSKIPSTAYEDITVFENSSGYAKDKEHVYSYDKIFDSDSKGQKLDPPIDVESFEHIDRFDFKDKHGCINVSRGRIPCEEK